MIRTLTVLAITIVCSGPLSAQEAAPRSLADVAREAEAAKPTIRKAKKTYTNADLAAAPQVQASSPAAVPVTGYMSSALGKPVSGDEMATRSQEIVDRDQAAQQTEEQWRARAESIRQQVAALHDRVDALSQPNPARDANPVAKSRNAGEIAKVQQGLQGLSKQWNRLEESAKESKVSSAWLDPRPKF